MKTSSLQILNNSLYIGKFPAESLAKKYQTPIYVYDETKILSNINRIKRSFTSDIIKCDIVYASKAFLAPRLASIISNNDLYIDSVSLADLHILKRSNFPFEKVLLHGNNKSLLELQTALEFGVGLIVVDSIFELETIIKLAQEQKISVKTLFRLNPHIQTSTHKYIQTSREDSKFGESIDDDEKMDRIVKLYKSSPYVKLVGFHTHIGSQITTVEPYLELTTIMIKFIEKFEKQYQFKLDILDLGGGFGIKYLESDQEFLFEKDLKQIVSLIENAVSNETINIKQLMIEPGRSIVGNAGHTLYEISQIKKTKSKNFVVVDGGMTDNIRPALYQAKYSHDIVTKMNYPKTFSCDIVGRSCESGDIVSVNTKVSKPEEGDILIVYNTGAYGYSMASNYNNTLKPAVIFVNDDQVHEVIRRESIDDLLKTYIF